MLRIEEYGERDQLAGLQARWKALITKSAHSTPYLSPEWYSSAISTIDKDSQMLLLFFSYGEHDVGLAPMLYREESFTGYKFYRVGFLKNPYCPFQGFVTSPDYRTLLADLIQYIRRKFGGRFILDLDEIPADEPTYCDFLRMKADELHCLHRQEDKNVSLTLPLQSSFHDVFERVDKKKQQDLRKKQSRISRLGSITLLRIQGESQIAEHLNTFFRLYAQTWKGAEPHPDFYFRLCKQLDSVRTLYFYSLLVDARPVAYLLAANEGSTVYSVKLTYDPAYYAFSPGVVLFYKLIETFTAMPALSHFHLGRGHEQYKRDWRPTIRPQVRVMVCPDNLAWRVSNSLRYTLLPALKKSNTFSIAYNRARATLTSRHFKPAADQSKKNQQQMRVFTWSQDDEHAQTPFSVRLAQENDVYHLAVAMSARNISEVRNRFLEKSECLLLQQRGDLFAYFWLPESLSGNSGKGATSGEISIENWGANGSGSFRKHIDDVHLATLLQFLHDKYRIRTVRLLCDSRNI